jgi:hypothetical protein
VEADVEEDALERLQLPAAGDRARIGLVWTAVSVADPASAECAFFLQEFANRLLAKRRMSVKLIREWDERTCRYFSQPLKEEADCQQESVRKTGLLLAREGQTVPIPLRELIIVRPPQPIKLVQALSEFESWLSGRPDDGLLGVCRALLERFRPMYQPHDIARWWSTAKPAERYELWWFLQRVVLLHETVEGSRPVCALLLATFEEEKFRLQEDLSGGATQELIQELPWMMTVSSTDLPAGRPTGRRGPTLCGPDGYRLAPAVWLLLREWQGGGRHLVEFEPRVQQVRARLQTQDDRDWSGWRDFNEQILDKWLGCLEGVPAPADSGRLLREWFEKFYQRMHEVQGGCRDGYRELARDLYNRLRKLGVALKPALDERLEAEKLPAPPTWVAEVKAGAEVGRIVRVLSFGDDQHPPRVIVGIGRDPPRELLPWLQLPPFHRQPRNAPEEVLVDWHKRAWQLLTVHPDTVAETVRGYRDKFAQVLSGPKGPEWLDYLARAATENPQAGYVRWLDVLIQVGWCKCFPMIRFQDGAAYWPRDASFRGTQVEIDFQPGQPSTEIAAGLPVLRPVKRFATEPSRACCTVRVEQGGPELDAVSSFWNIVRNQSALPGVFVQPFQEVLRVLVDHLHLQLPPSDLNDQAVIQLAGPLLEGLVHVAEQDRTTATSLLSSLGNCLQLQPLRLEVFPHDWAWLGETWQQEAGVSSDFEVVSEASSDKPGTVTGLQRFGLKRNGTVIQRALVQVSTGPEIPGLPELRKEIEKLPNDLDPRLLAQWHNCSKSQIQSQESFKREAVQLYRDLWEEGRPLREADRNRHTRITDLLLRVLEHLGLERFEPKNQLRDYGEDHCKFVEVLSDDFRHGRLTRIVSPGLKTAADEVWVRAKAEYA